MSANTAFYLCPMCFAMSDTEHDCCAHRMVLCDAGQPGDERRKPALDRGGRLTSRAPRWFWEAVRPQDAHAA